MERELFKKGDKVVMHTCIEAEKYNGKIWTCRTDEVVKGEGCYKQGLVFLEGFSGSFATDYLQKVNIEEKTNKLGKEKQEFQLGDTVYMLDEDYRFFESEVWRIELRDGKYYYDTHDCDFSNKDIGDWVFESKVYRELHLEAMM